MILELFTTFFKIGLFTFGGGYSMISIVKDECINKKKWITEEEFVDMVAVAESTPGPIAVNMATYIGYKKNKILGSIVATLGVVTPSIIIIYIIALYLEDFLKIEIIANAFFGIRIAVGIVIIKTGVSLLHNEWTKSTHKKLTLIMAMIFMIALTIIDWGNLKFNASLLMIIAIAFAVVFAVIEKFKDMK